MPKMSTALHSLSVDPISLEDFQAVVDNVSRTVGAMVLGEE